MQAEVSAEVSVAFNIDDQDAIEIPEALARALEEDTELATFWSQQTPGKQRGLAFRVSSAKSSETQDRRIEEILDIMAGRRDARGKLTSLQP